MNRMHDRRLELLWQLLRKHIVKRSFVKEETPEPGRTGPDQGSKTPVMGGNKP